MADKSAIEWTDATWNPVTGCDRVSPGCAHCYALDLAARLKSMHNPRYQVDGDPKTSGPGFGVTLHSDVLGKPQRWRKPRRVFVNSMSDLFHPEVPDRWIAEVFAVMRIAEQHIFQVLTKRPERMRDLLSDPAFSERVADAIGVRGYHYGVPVNGPIAGNVWLGVSIENRRFVHRADLLRETPAAVRFVSAEPLLGPLVPKVTVPDWLCTICDRGIVGRTPRSCPYCGCTLLEPARDLSLGLNLAGIDWVITGGESGPQHRRFDPQWAISLRDRCLIEGVAFLHKQNGGRTSKSGGRLLDGQTYDEFPSVPSTTTEARA